MQYKSATPLKLNKEPMPGQQIAQHKPAGRLSMDVKPIRFLKPYRFSAPLHPLAGCLKSKYYKSLELRAESLIQFLI